MGGSSGVEIKDSADQKAMAQIAKEKWTLYNEKYVPMENRWMQDISGWNDPSKYQQAAGVGNTSTNSAYGHAMNQLVSQGGNTGKLNAGINGMALGQNKGRVDLQNRMQVNQQNQYVAGLQNVANVGMGKEAQALNTMYDSASISSSHAASQAQNDLARWQSNQNAIGTGLGAVTRWGIS